MAIDTRLETEKETPENPYRRTWADLNANQPGPTTPPAPADWYVLEYARFIETLLRALDPIAGRGCEERTGPMGVVSCGRPPVALVGWVTRTEGPYWLCLACTSHYVRNRGGAVVRWVNEDIERAIVAQEPRP